MEKTFTEMLRQSLKDAHETLEGTMQGVTEEVAHWQPPGRALSVAASYAHAIVSEDMMLNQLAKKSSTLLDQGWSEKSGLTIPHPAFDANWEQNYVQWTKKVRIDLPKLQEYAKAVYKQTDDFMASLNDKNLSEKKVDLSLWQMGDWPVGRFIIRFLLSHIDSMTGEISAVKGLQDLKGYPF